MKITVEDKKIEVFHNRDIQFDFSNKSKCAIVGNSSILLNKEYGDLIDSHDTIVRFNCARTEGYEKHVGSKNDFRVLNGHVFAGTTDKSRSPEFNENFIPSLTSEKFLITYFDVHLLLKGIIENVNKNELYFFNQEYKKYCDSLVGHDKESTTGILAVMFFISYFKNVSLFGFNFYKENIENAHYWEKTSPSADVNQFHKFDGEEKLIKYLQDEGRVKLYE